MDVKRALASYKEKVDAKLRLFFKKNRENVISVAGEPALEMLDVLEDYTLRGGKRLRPALVYYGYKCFNENPPDAVIDASMSIELVQSFLLIHDDIIDRDDSRRGGPTVHKYYRELSAYTGIDKNHFGISMALVLGDIAVALGIDILTGLPFEPDRKLRAISVLSQTIHRVIYGETLDVISQYKHSVNEHDVMLTHKLKTSTYTVEAPLHIGALLAGASDSELSVLTDYAIPIGQAFQLQDDILGMFGTEEKLGKPVGSDLREGKKTMLIVKALEKATPVQKQMLLNVLGKPNVSVDEVEKVRKLIIDTGSLGYSKRLASRLVTKAKNAILDAPLLDEGKEFLLSLADYLVQREY